MRKGTSRRFRLQAEGKTVHIVRITLSGEKERLRLALL